MKIKKLNIQSGISIDSQVHISCSSESLFTLTIYGSKTDSMPYPLKKHNIFDCSCLHTKPDESAFQKAIAFAFLYKSSFPDSEAAADNTAVAFVCGESSPEFFHYLSESGFTVTQCRNGICHVNIMMPVQIFIILMPQLEKSEHSRLETFIKHAFDEASETENIRFPECIFHTAES